MGLIGLGLLWVGGLTAFFMHARQAMPRRLKRGAHMRYEDSEAYRIYMAVMIAMAAVGAALLAIQYLTGW